MNTTDKTNNDKPTQPEALSLFTLHTPQEVRQHQAAMHEYHANLHNWNERQRLIDQAKQEPADRNLTEDQYYELAKKRKQEQDARDEARRLERIEAELAEAAYLGSMPEFADVLEASEFLLLTKLQTWFQKGYTLENDSVQHFIPGAYAIRLKRPAKAKKAD